MHFGKCAGATDTREIQGCPPVINPSISRAASPVATFISESQDQPRLTYFARIEGNPGASKTEAVENGLYLDAECSQEVDISKTFVISNDIA